MLVKNRSKAIFKVPRIMYNQYLNKSSIFIRSIWHISHISKIDDSIPPISCLQTTSSSIRNPVKYMSRNSFFYDRFYILDRVRCKATKNIRSLPGQDNDTY